MQKLIDSGLFGQGLTAIDSPNLVDLYNACLKEISLEPTALKSFKIDGWGWSPDIATERKNPFYLSHDVADPFAIILTPDQYNKPIYFPCHSFDRRLMRFVFDSAKAQISNLTTRTGIWLDIDQEVDHYLGPEDLLMVDSVSVKFHSVGHIMSQARHQRELVRKFKDSDTAWMDLSLRQAIIESAKKVGDLRFKNLVINDIAFNDVKSFYSRAFGGVYVFRELRHGEFLLVVEDKATAKNVDTERDCVFHIKDYGLVDKLVKEGLIEVSLDWYRENKKRLAHLLRCLFIDAMSKVYPDVDLNELNSGQEKYYINHLYADNRLPKLYYEIKKLMRRLVPSYKNNIKVPRELELVLFRPTSNLSEPLKDVVWQLLVKITPIDIYRLYSYDKEEFFRQYNTWPESKKNWWIKFLVENYIPRTDQH